MRLAGLVVAAGVALAAGRVGPQTTSVVGILESPECQNAGEVGVRAVFAKTGSDWIALDGAPAVDRVITSEVAWTVALDGQSLGTVRTIDPKLDTKFTWTGTGDRPLRLSPGQQPPRRPDPAHRFGGWCASVPDRPLVVVNQPNFSDPDGWTAFDPPLTSREALLPQFRIDAGDVMICPNNPTKDIQFDYNAHDLLIVSAYRDRTGRSIVAVQLDPKRNGCAGPSGPEWSPHWYLLGDQPRALGPGLQLVDAGDYDGDGKSELLFWYTGSQGEGYTLFSDDLQKRVDLRWVSR